MSLVLATVAALAMIPVLSANHYAEAVPNSQVSGSGFGTVVCPSQTFTSGQISFFAQKSSSGIVSGSWVIFAFGTQKSGPITGGSIGQDHFNLRGAENQAICSFDLFQPSTVTISGECGPNSAIKFTAKNGESGRFVGNVNCA